MQRQPKISELIFPYNSRSITAGFQPVRNALGIKDLRYHDLRLAFPALFEPKTVNGEGEPRFSATFIFPPDHPCVKDIEAAIAQVAKEKWGPKADSVLKSLRADLKVCLHHGDEKQNTRATLVTDSFPPVIKHAHC